MFFFSDMPHIINQTNIRAGAVMTDNDYLVSRFDRAAVLLPQELRRELSGLSAGERAPAEEIRLRVGFPPTVLRCGEEFEVGKTAVNTGHISALLETVTCASPYSAADAIRSGYVTARGGFRVGLCGSVITENGRVSGFREFSSAAVRISREIIGCADGVLGKLENDKGFGSMLIISPPGCGKTTLLRDIVRRLSDGKTPFGEKRIGLCDERSEIAAMYSGRAQFNVGRRTDILDACPKAEAAMMLLRAMKPDIIVMDEVTAPADIAAIEKTANCGVSIIASAHAESLCELKSRPLYRRLIGTGVFGRAVIISRKDGERKYGVISI